jgi:hypothetical protein
MEQLYRRDSVSRALLFRASWTTGKWGWSLSSKGYWWHLTTSMKTKRLFNKTQISQILETLKNNVKPTVFQKFSRIIVINCTGSAHYFMGTKFVPLRKSIRSSWYQWRWNFSEEQPGTHLFDHKRYDEILEELKVEPNDEKLRRYKWNRLRHVRNKNEQPTGCQKIMLNYRPIGQRRLGRPLKRQSDDAKTGLWRHNSWMMMMIIIIIRIITRRKLNSISIKAFWMMRDNFSVTNFKFRNPNCY